MSLRGWLTGEEDPRSDGTLRHQLASPWGWPHGDELQRRALERGAHEPNTKPALGETLLVAVDSDGLWKLTPSSARDTDVFTRYAKQSAELARRAALRDIDGFVDPIELPRAQGWGAALFMAPGQVPPTLDGESFGLAFALSTASRLLHISMPANFVASAALSPIGELCGVEGLRHKLELVLDEALGVSHFLVAASQEQEVIEELARIADERRDPALRDALTIVGMESFADACLKVFPAMEGQMRERWDADPKLAKIHAERFHLLALQGTPMVLGWPAIARVAAELGRRLPEERERMARVESIALRHAGKKVKGLPWPGDGELRAMYRAPRFQLLSHVVQSHADGEDDGSQIAQRALRYIGEPLDRTADELKLLGAIGRAFASSGEYTEAAVHLRAAIKGWKEAWEGEEISRPLCELLRVLGMAGHTEEVVALCENEVDAYELAPGASDMSIGFLRVAAGRALVQVNEPTRACEYLTRPTNGPLPVHLEKARQRWLARALHDCGDLAGAAKEREKLWGRTDDPSSHDQLILARLDDAIENSQEITELIDELRGYPDGEALIARRLCPWRDNDAQSIARFVTEHCRY